LLPAARRPAGQTKLGSLDNVTYINMRLNLATARNFALACPAGSALVNYTMTDLSSSYVSVTMFVGIPNTTVVQ
jgi:hypothetical protein